jgi:hypothetical protein
MADRWSSDIRPADFWGVVSHPSWPRVEQYFRQRKAILESEFRALQPGGLSRSGPGGEVTMTPVSLEMVGAMAMALNASLTEIDFVLGLKRQSEEDLHSDSERS